MNYGIGNVKGKSSGGGGGGIPVITLQASQMISQTQIQFTEEQYNTIVANGCFYLDLLGSQQLLMTCVNASNLADIQCYNISQTGSGLQLATIDLNKTTYIGVLGVSPYPQAKKLYNHNIKIRHNYSGGYIIAFFTIPHEKSTAFSLSELKTLIGTYYGANDFYTAYPASGYKVSSGSFTFVASISASSNGITIWYGNYVSDVSNDIAEITENIVAL